MLPPSGRGGALRGVRGPAAATAHLEWGLVIHREAALRTPVVGRAGQGETIETVSPSPIVGENH